MAELERLRAADESTAARLPTSDASPTVFEAIARRLARSARTFRTHYTSRNYYENALKMVFHQDD